MIAIYFSSGKAELDVECICEEIAQMHHLENNQYIVDDKIWDSILFNNARYLKAGPIVSQWLKNI